MEKIDKKIWWKIKKSSSLEKWISENLAVNINAESKKSESTRLYNTINDFFASECYKMCYEYGKSNNNYHYWETYNENELAEYVLSLYKKFQSNVRKSKFNLTDDEANGTINRFVKRFCKTRAQKMEDNTRWEYITFQWERYWAEKKWNKDAIIDSIDRENHESGDFNEDVNIDDIIKQEL